jgi:Flp pilus assembly protein TadG
MALLLLFGILEFGLLFGQKLDVANGTREVARLAAVNFSSSSNTGFTQTGEIVAEVCSRMELADDAEITISFPGNKSIGDTAHVEIATTVDLVTGVFDPWFSSAVLANQLEIRLEQVATYSSTTGHACP